MGGEVRGVPEAPPLSAEGGGAEPIGAYLARQRSLRGISLDDLATLTKIPRRSLERLESGAFDGEPDGFARGFVRTVAVALGLDPEDAVMRLMGEPLEGDEWGERQGWRIWLLAFAAIGALVGIGFGATALWQAVGAPRFAVESSEVVYRRDAVRALAESVSASPPHQDDNAVEGEREAGEATGAAGALASPGGDPSN